MTTTKRRWVWGLRTPHDLRIAAQSADLQAPLHDWTSVCAAALLRGRCDSFRAI